jgi:hypothetical protein
MSFMITATGAEYHLCGLAMLDPAACEIRIEDIAHHLAQINRFTGACVRPYSVAEHSLLVSEIAQRAGASVYVQFAALLHDAHEAFVTDVSSPAKEAVNYLAGLSGGTRAWAQFEGIHARLVRQHFKLTSVFAGNQHALRLFDLQALATERRDLTAWREGTHAPWGVLGDGQDLAMRIAPIDWVRLDAPEREHMTWSDWRAAFADRFDELTFAIELMQGGAVQGAGQP